MMWGDYGRPVLEGLSEHLIANARGRFEHYALPDPNSGCWLWSGYINERGYGMIDIGSTKDGTARPVVAHRLAWELYRGPIPKGRTIDHRVCRKKYCVNPDHLAICTALENVEQPDGLIGKHRHRTHCPHGHPYSGDNLYVTSQGFRQCKTCARARQNKLKEIRNEKRHMAAPN